MFSRVTNFVPRSEHLLLESLSDVTQTSQFQLRYRWMYRWGMLFPNRYRTHFLHYCSAVRIAFHSPRFLIRAIL